MTSARRQRGKVVGAPAGHNVGAINKEIVKSTKRTSGQRHKAIGKIDNFAVENDENCSPSCSAVIAQHPGRDTCLLETSRKLPALDLYPGQILCPSVKIKLQLFPIDEGIRMGLEKDGFHPYLELTLSTRKKISSVLKHLNSKWGSSSVALGEPLLFPYNTAEKMARYRWTMNDNDITAGEVYAAIGNPTVFRLRYGWLSNSEAETSGMPSTSTFSEGFLESEDMLKDCGTKVENTNDEVKQIEVKRGGLKAVIENGETNEGLPEMVSSDRPFDSMGNEMKTDNSTGQSSLLWADSLTNISIGGLLSEVSLQGKLNNSDNKPNGSEAGLQPSLLNYDSFDAFLAGQMNHSHIPRQTPQVSGSSILDAEDTCHAFAFKKFSSSEKDAPASCKSFSQGVDPETIKFPNRTEANIQSGIPQGHANQESETDQLLSLRVHNDESSLGLSGIKWTESLGPFDLGLSSSQKILNGDNNISKSGIVN